MPQTSVLDAPAKAYAGMIADSGYRHCITLAAESAVVAGSPVLFGTDPDTQAAPITNGATVDGTTAAGFVVLDDTRPYDATNPIAAGDSIAVMRQGRMYVRVTTPVVAGKPVYVGNATAQLGEIGDTAGAGLAVFPGARFLSSAASGELALVSINMD